MDFWKGKYKKEAFYWSLNPSPSLKRVLSYAPKEGVALDIGAGEGRNSIFLAKKGFHVVAVDKIPEGLEKLENFAKKQNLSIETHVLDIENFHFPSQKYSLVLSVAALDFMRFSSFRNIIKKVEDSLLPQGVVYLSVFSINDPFFAKLNKEQFKNIEDKSDLEVSIIGKGENPRTVYFSERALSWLKKYLKARKDDKKPLFINYRGRTDASPRLTARSIERIVKKCTIKAGIPIFTTPHTLRHSMATDLLGQGVDLRSIQEFLGHRSITSTQIYTHVTNKRLHDIHKKYHGGRHLKKE